MTTILRTAAAASMLFLLFDPAVAADADIDGAEDFAQIARNGFSFVVDGDFFGGPGQPNLVANPLGSPRNSYAWSMAWFDGGLWVGTTRDVLCLGGGLSSTCDVDEEGNVVVGDEQRAEIWRYTPSAGDFGLSGSWERVFQSPFVGFPLNLFEPDLPRDIGYRSMATCDVGGRERLYVGTMGLPGHILYHDGVDFVPTSTSGLYASINDLRNGEADLGYRSLVCFKRRLWTAPAGSIGDIDGSKHSVVLMNPDPTGGAAWQTVLDARTDPVLGDPDDIGIFQMEAIGDALYVSVGNRTTGFELWKGDGSDCQTPPGPCPMSWSKIIDDGGGRLDDGAAPVVDNAGATLGVFDGQLYVGAAESGANQLTLAELMRVHQDGTWELLAGWPRFDFASVENMRCPSPVDLPSFVDPDSDLDDCYPSSLQGPGLGPGPFEPGTVSYFWRFVEHENALYLGTLELTDGDGFDLYRSEDGVAWTALSKNGFGNAANYGIRTFASVPGLGLVLGTANPYTDLPGGTEVWVGTTAPGEDVPPVAVAGDDTTVFDWDQDDRVTVALDGGGSTDPLGGSGIVSYEWFEGALEDLGGSCAGITAAPFSTEPAPAVEKDSFDPSTGSERLTYDFTLRVEDAAGIITCDEIAVTASRNLPPSAVVTASVPFAPAPELDDTPDVRLVDFDGDGVESFDLTGLCTDFEGDLVGCSWHLQDPGNRLSDASGCAGTDRCELATSVESTVTTGASLPDILLVTEDGAGNTSSFLFEVRVRAVVDTEDNDRPVCRSSTFTMVEGLDDEIVIDPTAEPRLCEDPDGPDSRITYTIRSDSRYPAADNGTVTGGAFLTYTPDAGFVGTDRFYFRASDALGERSRTVGVRVRVVEEIEPPEVSVTFPADGEQLGAAAYRVGCDSPERDVCGVASDDASGVDRVLVAIRDGAGNYWDGSGFGSADEVRHLARGTERWSLPFTPPTEGDYVVTATAIDRSGKDSAPVESGFRAEADDATRHRPRLREPRPRRGRSAGSGS